MIDGPPALATAHPTWLPTGRAVEELAKRRFLFITGKGGVGKTTVAASLATAMAARGKRVLVAMCNTKERLSTMLGAKPIGHDLASVGSDVWAVNISPERALREYGDMVFRIGPLARAIFENRYTKTFFRATPGLYEWAMLGKAWFHTTERRSDGSLRFDVVLLDAPATGHGMDMLRVPKVILDVVPPGILRRDAELAWAMFRDPIQSGVVLVTLPEEMPTTETVELSRSIQGELGLPIHTLVVNGVLPPLFSPAEREVLLSNPGLLDVDAPARATSAGARAIVAGARRAIREKIQAEAIARLLHEIALPKVALPFVFESASPVATTHLLASYL